MGPKIPDHLFAAILLAEVVGWERDYGFLVSYPDPLSTAILLQAGKVGLVPM